MWKPCRKDGASTCGKKCLARGMSRFRNVIVIDEISSQDIKTKMSLKNVTKTKNTLNTECHPERREAKPNGVEGPHIRWQRRQLRGPFSRHRCRKCVSTVVASQADLG